MKLLYSLVFVMGCSSLSSNPKVLKDPLGEMNQKTPLADLLDIALTYGEEPMDKAKKLISKRKLWPQTAQALQILILDHHESWPSARLMNGFALYQMAKDPKSPKVFQKTVRSDRLLAQDLAWGLAAHLPSPAMAKEIESRLDEALIYEEIQDLFRPQMPLALAANQLTKSYSFLKQGLITTNHPTFVEGMAKLNPKQASGDFLDYLAQAPVEELRQLNLKTVDLMSCLGMLAHMKEVPPPVTHPRFEALFLFSISRNTALNELARSVLGTYLPRESETLSIILSAQPSWVQLAYIENARRDFTPALGLLLSELKKRTAQKDVIHELNQVLR
jgi:hypothetical protein